jgi:multidrug resistance efflux pump
MNHKNQSYYFALTIGAIGLLLVIAAALCQWLPVTDLVSVEDPTLILKAPQTTQVRQVLVSEGQKIQPHQLLFTFDNQLVQEQITSLKLSHQALAAKHAVLTNERAANRTLQRELTQALAAIPAPSNQQAQQLRLKLQQLTTQAKLLQLKLKAMQLERQANQAQLAALARVHSSNHLRAPLGGEIHDLVVVPGQVVAAGDKLGYLTLATPPRLRAWFLETDLVHATVGSKVLIIPKSYLGRKVYHGVIASNYWQPIATPARNLEVTRAHWLSAPRRLQVPILVTETIDPQFPLRPGISAYAYVQTN